MIKKSHINGKVKYKLNLAFFILSHIHPLEFHALKSFQQKKTKASLVLEIQSIKSLLTRYFFNLLYNNKNFKEKDLLLIKNYLIHFETFNIKSKHMCFDTLKTKEINQKAKLICDTPETLYENFILLRDLIYLEDFLSV